MKKIDLYIEHKEYYINNKPIEELITWINKKYEEYLNIINKLNEVPN